MEGDLELAEQLWTRILAVSPADPKALKALKRVWLKGLSEITPEKAQKDVKFDKHAVAEKKAQRDVKFDKHAVAEYVNSRTIKPLRKSTVLWVDDRPNNIIYERQSLEALGINFVLAQSTEEAFYKLNRQDFDLIISDMGRPPDPRAGYTLLDQLRSCRDRTPFIIYSTSRHPKHIAESLRHGAIGCTNRPSELFEMVLSVLVGKNG
ncbi:MAG: response regulator [Symploca sp. SIO1A3]|nr:response regulator [Symploca sp. SIO1A3]